MAALTLADDDVDRIARQVASYLGDLLPHAPQPADDDPHALISEPAAAALLRVQPHVLRDARKRGELHCTKIGKSVRYTRDQLDAYLRRQTR
jgi:hypothetical protein